MLVHIVNSEYIVPVMRKPIKVHHANPSDRYAIAFLDQCLLSKRGGQPTHIDPAFEASWDERFEARRHSNNHRGIIIAEHAGIIIGFANFSLGDPRNCLLEKLAVERLYQHQGYGSFLLSVVISELPPSQQAISVEVSPHLSDAIPFFTKHGFAQVNTSYRTTTGESVRLTKRLDGIT